MLVLAYEERSLGTLLQACLLHRTELSHKSDFTFTHAEGSEATAKSLPCRQKDNQPKPMKLEHFLVLI